MYEQKSSHQLVRVFLAGSLSGSFSAVLFQPLDLLKTRLQAPVTLLNGPTSTPSRCSIIKILKNENVLAWWKGLTPTLYRTIPGVGLYFTTLHYMKSFIGMEPTFYENLLLGFTARSVVGVSLLPTTVIKTRYESGHFSYRSVPSAFRQILAMEGHRGLFSGATATIARDAPYSGLYLMFYSQAKKSFNSILHADTDPAVKHYISGIIAGLAASLVTQPADVVKTHMQLGSSKHSSTLQCMKNLVRENGLSVLYRGTLPRCTRRTLISALSWTLFEELAMQFNLKI